MEAQKKRKSRGAKLSKAEREARREQRLHAATADNQGGLAFQGRQAQLLAHVAMNCWDEALALGVESVPLARELVRALVPLRRHRQLVHAGRRFVQARPFHLVSSSDSADLSFGLSQLAPALRCTDIAR